MSNINENLLTNNTKSVVIPENIPEELKNLRNWVCWRYQHSATGKPTKTPYMTHGDFQASTNKPTTWDYFPAAVLCYRQKPITAGIGFNMLDAKDPNGLDYVGIDFDGGKLSGEPTAMEWAIAKSFNSYTERTPSGCLRVWIKVDLSKINLKEFTTKQNDIEWYHSGENRYFTVTGQRVDGFPIDIMERQREFQNFLIAYMIKEESGDLDLDFVSKSDTLPPPNLEVAERLDQLQAYLDACPGAIEGRNASGYCFAVVLTSLWGFDLVDYRDLVEERLIKWGERKDQSNINGSYNPWTAAQIQHKIESALESTYNGTIGDKLRKVELLDLPEGAEGTIIEELPPRVKKVSTEIVDPCFDSDMGKKETLPSTAQFFYAADAWDMPPSKPLIKRHLNKGTLTFVAGDSGTGKSFFVIDMAMAIATGNDFLGKYKTYGNGRPVVYLCGEGSDGVKKRICAWMQYHDTITRNMITLPFRFNFLDDNDIERIISQIDLAFPNNPPALIIGDTLSKMYLGEENNGKDPKIVMSNAERLIKHYDCSFLFVHHHGKDASKGMRGFSGFQCDADNVIVLEKSEIIDPESQITSKIINTKAKDEGRLEDYYVNFKKVELQHPETSLPILDDDLIPLDSLVAEISGLSNRDYRQQEIDNKLVAELKPFSNQLSEEPQTVLQIKKKLTQNNIDISEKTVRRRLTELVKIGFANKTEDSPIRFYLNKSY